MQKMIVALSLMFSPLAIAHDFIRCLSADQNVYAFLNFDGNGMPLVTANLRIDEAHFAAKVDPAHFPMRRQQSALQIDYGSYILVLGLSEKTAMVSKAGVKNEYDYYVSDGTPDMILNCCQKSDVKCDYHDPKAPPEQ